VDALTDIPLARVLSGLPLSKSIAMALLAERGEFAPVHRLVSAYEQGRWGVFSQAAALLGLEEGPMPGLFAAAREWADAALQCM
jgi:c-di-GMP-related signal transduction protein